MPEAVPADVMTSPSSTKSPRWSTSTPGKRTASSARPLADWIEGTAERFEKSLQWLYALRNTALHDGRFTSATDLLDVHAGRALVDLTLEFLGNWYRHEANAAPEHTGLTAIEAIAHLADRQQDLLTALRSGIPTRWNATRLTSPTSAGWERI